MGQPLWLKLKRFQMKIANRILVTNSVLTDMVVFENYALYIFVRQKGLLFIIVSNDGTLCPFCLNLKDSKNKSVATVKTCHLTLFFWPELSNENKYVS